MGFKPRNPRTTDTREAIERCQRLPVLVVIKECKCGLAYTRDSWAELELAFVTNERDHGHAAEYRHCRCLSTIAVDLDVSQSLYRGNQ